MRCADLVPIFNLVANLASTSECHSIYSILKLRCHTVATLTTSLRSDISEAELADPFQALRRACVLRVDAVERPPRIKIH